MSTKKKNLILQLTSHFPGDAIPPHFRTNVRQIFAEEECKNANAEAGTQTQQVQQRLRLHEAAALRGASMSGTRKVRKGNGEGGGGFHNGACLHYAARVG